MMEGRRNEERAGGGVVGVGGRGRGGGGGGLRKTTKEPTLKLHYYYSTQFVWLAAVEVVFDQQR